MNVCTSLALALAFALAGCGGTGGDSGSGGAELDLTLDPAIPVVGMSRLLFAITEPDGTPLEGARLRIEGNMNHAGMVPEFADATETRPGHYEAELEFTMGGDWFLLVDAETADGRHLSWKEDVPGVGGN